MGLTRLMLNPVCAQNPSLTGEQMAQACDIACLHHYGKHRGSEGQPRPHWAVFPCARLRGVRVLLQDDEETIREIITSMLARAGHECLQAETPKETLDI
jgi:PleD family two-component response regulator